MANMTSTVPPGAGAPPRVPAPGGIERARLRRDLGVLLRTERVAAGYSQETFATALGMSRCHIARLENGRARPSDVSTRRIAEVLRDGDSDAEIALLDLRLQRAAGDSLQVYRRRIPWRRRRVVAYERAAKLLDGARPDPGGTVVAGRVAAALDAAAGQGR